VSLEYTARDLPLNILRRGHLELHACFVSSKIEFVDEIGVVHVIAPSKVVETRKANNALLILLWNSVFPYFVRNVKIKLLLASANTTLLPLEAFQFRLGSIICSAWIHVDLLSPAYEQRSFQKPGRDERVNPASKLLL
jgi:hypothetical protein